MDITAQTFGLHLPKLLDELSTCCFVSLDFEFSGIAKSHTGGMRRKSTLQERYEEVKASADQYQILQVGLTICHEDPITGIYTLRPYNLYLSPIVDSKLDVERDWSFQSSAIAFLLANRFSMESLFTNGVTYLARDEEQAAITRAIERRDRPPRTATTLGVDETEHESLAFLQEVRVLVDAWLKQGSARRNYLNIPPASRPNPTHEPSSSSMPVEINRFQKRLIHQLIEVEYPSLTTIGKQGFVQIIDYDEEREKAVHEQRIQFVQEKAWKQRGFRWIAEALAGGDLTKLGPHYFINIMEGLPGRLKGSLKDFSDRIKRRLQTNRPVLVGHNLFTDLIYFCRCFFGPLPDRVEDFQAMAHQMFPVLMDTKYMATHDCGSINPTSSLQEINDNLVAIPYPRISVHPQHSKYHAQGIDHEAGYDSLLTAQVFIKLSAQLRDRGANENPTPSHPQAPDQASARRQSQHMDQARVSLPIRPKPSNVQIMFGTVMVNKVIENPVGNDSILPPGADEMALSPNVSPQVQQKVNKGELIPRLGARFWSVYGNKLRVFGPSASDSRVCRSCQETIVRRNFASAAATEGTPETTTAPPSSAFPVVKPAYTIKAGVLLSRPPQITRDLTDFEKAYFFYQRRLNERLTLPFTKYFYFKRGTPADEDWKRKIRERQTAARDIGNYNAYSPEAWNDELLVGAVESDPAHQVEMLVRDAEATVNATSQDTSKKEEVARPMPRVTEADEKGDDKSLNRALQRTLYLLVQSKEGYWKFPSSPVETEETIKQAAERTLAQSAGVNMNTWFVGYHPVGHYVYNVRKPTSDHLGEKTFFMKSRIFTGQADLSGNTDNLTDFKWLAKDEISKYVRPQYYASIKNMLAER
ncbi:mitochondrial 54S ribosomal mL46 domain-containing protein [Aspergillus homomorphus CBS 101889]|uniref:Large ribosomal subunit protein mL46 n=1 Tax=Aspergillus homomorphus (strain CBS 101889) TaxID=1450537 RepID=A0A395I504_ASPHC|nr:CAF1 family ribonuclease [Aspergillus homomorphus CBS 101889]RAL14819.1 CAF1 family ribonuclease [Aspergillus homomorphus CBS 101889]